MGELRELAICQVSKHSVHPDGSFSARVTGRTWPASIFCSAARRPANNFQPPSAAAQSPRLSRSSA